MKIINSYVSRILLDKDVVNFKHDVFNTKVDNAETFFQIKMAKRLIKYYCKFKEKKISIFDLLVTLRNYLIVTCCTIAVSDTLKQQILKFQNEFGFKFDGEGNVYAVTDLRETTNESLINTGFIRNKGNKNEQEKYFIRTSAFIKNLTGFEFYKSIEQKLAVTGALNTPVGYTTLVALPTGGGKSLITQVVPYQVEKSLTVVIVPTVSLAMDQKRVARKNIKHNSNHEIYYYYSKTKECELDEMINSIESETAKIIFISPEAIIKNKRISKVIRDANDKHYLKNVIIDEAHLLIEWGTFFRMDYQFLEIWRKGLLKYNTSLRTYLLSATFEKKTVSDLKLMFSVEKKWIEIRCDALRKEPRFVYIQTRSYEEKKHKMIELIHKLPRPMIVYVTSPDTAERVKKILISQGYSNIPTYTGKTQSQDREKLINDWENDEFDLIIATSAFGVGVDKPDVRTVLHLFVPANPNEYYQELGRGGRDGLPCLSVMCIDEIKDLNAAFSKLEKVLSNEKIIGRWFSMLDSRTSLRSSSTINLDTSVKPSYNLNDEDDETEGSIADIKWNIYVILLLRRYNLLTIENITTDIAYERYNFEIKIIEYRLMENNDEAFKVIEKIREKEWHKLESDFYVIKNTIKNHKFVCWSDMFTDSYDRVDEYCAGCNTHENAIGDVKDFFPLRKKISEPIKRIETKESSLFSYYGEIIVNGKKYDYKTIANILKQDVNAIILDYDYQRCLVSLLNHLDQRSDVNLIGIDEFDELVKKQSWYWISGKILVLHSGDFNASKKLVNLTKKAVKNSLCIHYFDEDYREGNGRSIVNQIEGPHIEAYLFSDRRN